MYCPHCDIRYKVRLSMSTERENELKAQICYRCGGPTGIYFGNLMDTTEELAEHERFFEEPDNIQILSIYEKINNLFKQYYIGRQDKDTLNILLNILEEDRQAFEHAQTEDIPVFEINKDRLSPPFFEEF